jgi:hypothetical protein
VRTPSSLLYPCNCAFCSRPAHYQMLTRAGFYLVFYLVRDSLGFSSFSCRFDECQTVRENLTFGRFTFLQHIAADNPRPRGCVVNFADQKRLS